MTPVSKKKFMDWQAEHHQDRNFVAAERELEPGYRVARPSSSP